MNGKLVRGRQYHRSPAHERVLAQVEVVGECWIYQGTDNGKGYGTVGENGRTVYAHRVVYAAIIGPIPDGMQLDHVKARGCTSRKCVNPDHLEAVTSRENTLRGDGVTARHAMGTHCPQGHPRTPEHIYVRPDGTGTMCGTCSRERARVRSRAKSKRRS